MRVYRFNWCEVEGQGGEVRNCQLCPKKYNIYMVELRFDAYLRPLNKFCKLLQKEESKKTKHVSLGVFPMGEHRIIL